MNVLQPIGRFFLAFLATAGRLALFTGRGISHCTRPPFYPRMVPRQMEGIGYFSLPVGDIDASSNPHVDQFNNGRAEGPIKMAVRA